MAVCVSEVDNCQGFRLAFMCLLLHAWLQIGPEKGVIHLATAAVINALWDFWGKIEGKVRLRTEM